MSYYNRRSMKYQMGGMMRQDFNVRSAFADQKMNRELSNYFDTMYGSYVPYDSDDEYHTDYESDTDDDEYYDIDERPIESQESNINIFSKIDLRIPTEVHVILDSELCEIIPFNCKIPGYRLYTLIFEISLDPFKYMRLKDVIVNEERLSESMPLVLTRMYGNFDDVIDRINGTLFYTDSDFLPEGILEENDLNENIGMIQSQIYDGNVYEKDKNVLMIETNGRKKFTLILDFNRESQKTDLDAILRPDVTVTRCTRENSSNHCEGLTETTPCSINDCRNKIFTII